MNPIRASANGNNCACYLLAAHFVAILLLVACAGDESQPTATPSSMPAFLLPSAPPTRVRQPTPTPRPPTPTPAPTLTPLPLEPLADAVSGRAVYLLDRDLWLAPLDGSRQPTRITSGSVGAGYAGTIADTQGNMIIYYTSQESGDREGGSFGVYLYEVATDRFTRIFGFEGSNKNAEFYCCNVSVSPDGAFIAYAQGDGSLMVYEVSTGERWRAARGGLDRPCSGVNPECFSNFFPQWSPAGDVILFERIYFEGSRHLTVRPFEIDDPQAPPDFVAGFATKGSWAKDGRHLCGAVGESNYGSLGPPAIHDLSTGETFDLSDVFIAGLSFTQAFRVRHEACAWGPDGHVAFSFDIDGVYQGPIYSGPVTGEDGTRIVLLAPDGWMLLRTPPGAGRVVAWLPDSSGVVYGQTPRNAPPNYVLLTRGGNYYQLPLEADRILAILP